VYDSSTGKQLWELPLGATTSGSPSMYEIDGRQYLLVTASTAPGARIDPNIPAAEGPTGIVAYALPTR
jgi:quinoprotein glucose dehydrogenase